MKKLTLLSLALVALCVPMALWAAPAVNTNQATLMIVANCNETLVLISEEATSATQLIQDNTANIGGSRQSATTAKTNILKANIEANQAQTAVDMAMKLNGASWKAVMNADGQAINSTKPINVAVITNAGAMMPGACPDIVAKNAANAKQNRANYLRT